MRRIILPIVLLVAAWAVDAQAQRHYTEIDFDSVDAIEPPEIERLELDNGIILYLVEDHELPLINISARIGTGSLFEPAAKRGLAGITGSVMRTGGTSSMSGDEIDEMLESIGGAVETSIGLASGSASMSVLEEYTDTGLSILADLLMDPAFPEDRIELAKSQARTAISRRNDNPSQIAVREFRKLVYGEDSPYAAVPEYEMIDRIQREDLVDFHREYFQPNNVMMGVWGAFDAGEMAEKIAMVFDGWEADREVFTRPPDVVPNFEHTLNLVQRDDANQSVIFIGHLGGLMSDPNYFALQVMNDILSGGFSGRLFRSIRSEQGLAYSVSGQYGANFNYPGLFYVNASTRSDATVEAVRALIDEIERMKDAPPSEVELEQAKDSYLNSFVFNFDTHAKIINRLMTYEYWGYPQDFLERTRDEIEEVSAEDVHRVAQEYLQADKLHILVVGNQDDFDEPLSALGEVRELDVSIPQPVAQ